MTRGYATTLPWSVVAAWVTAGAVGFGALTTIRPCRGGLMRVMPPPGWERGTESALAPFVFTGKPAPMGLGEGPQYSDAWIHDPGMCSEPRSGVEASGAFLASSLRLRADPSGAFVVTSMEGDAKGDNAVGERTPLVAFRRSKRPKLVFTSARSRAIGIFLGPVFVVTALFARAAFRAHRRGRQGPTRAGLYAGVSILIGILAFLLVCIGSLVWWIVGVWLTSPS